jgi:hypothetical protein
MAERITSDVDSNGLTDTVGTDDSNSSYFAKIDSNFIGIEKIDDDIFYFKSENTNILEYVELPIPINVRGIIP